MALPSKALLSDLKSAADKINPILQDQAASRRLVFALLLIKYMQQHAVSLGPSLDKLCAPSDNATKATNERISALTQNLCQTLENYREKLHSEIFSTATIRQAAHNLPDESVREMIRAILALDSNFQLETLIYIYQHFFLVGEQNKDGIFYTPLPLVRHIVTDTLGAYLKLHPGKDLLSLRVLDPACGSGLFLIEAARYILNYAQLNAQNISPDQVIRNCIFGVDKDAHAVSLSRLVLSLFCLECPQMTLFPDLRFDLSPNIHSGDSLLDDGSFIPGQPSQELLTRDPSVFCWSLKYPKVMQDGGFDCIIGNPPYGLSRDEQLSTSENEKLKQTYKEFRCGKINKYILFMARGYQLLKKGGCLSYVVPNSWLGIKGGSAIRKLFLSARCLKHVSILHAKTFDDLSVETVTFRIDKGQKYRHLDIIKLPHLGEEESSAQSSSFKLPYKACEATADMAIPLGWSKEVRSVLRRIYSRSLRLESSSSPFLPMIALQAYAENAGNPPQSADDVKNHIFHSDKKLDDTCYPYLEGSDVSRYRINWSGSWLKYGPWLAEPQNIERFCGPRILLREIINKAPYVLHAAITEESVLYNKSVLHILLKQSDESNRQKLLALLAILNSKLASFLILQRGRKSQRRLFPKILNEDLIDFPLPSGFAEDYDSDVSQLAKLAQLIIKLSDSKNMDDTKQIQQQIDLKVYESYRLRACDIALVDKSLLSGTNAAAGLAPSSEAPLLRS